MVLSADASYKKVYKHLFFIPIMKKRVGASRLKIVLLTIGVFFFFLFFVLPFLFALFGSFETGNVALIPIEGAISGGGTSGFGASEVSSKDIVSFIEDADDDPQIEVLLLEINSPGGSAVASDEIATAVKNAQKPVVALIREAGASGAYWIASASDQVIANRMSITGSIGVVSSYLEFSGLMEQYGVGYEELISGERKDLGNPYQKLTAQEKLILQKKLDKIHAYFIEEVAANRNLEIAEVQKIATGEFFLGVEALDLGLVDALGSKDDAEIFIKENYALEEIDYAVYQRETSFFELFGGVISHFFFNVGEGIGSVLVNQPLKMWM